MRLVLVAVLFWACGSGARPSDPGTSTQPAVAAAAPAAGAPTDPAEMYARYCALCHGADREGYAADNAPSLRSPELLGAGRGAFLTAAIAYGRPGTPMAAFLDAQGGPLDQARITKLHDWLVDGVPATELPTGPIRGDVVAGAALYGDRCASCHGALGEGVTGPALRNPVYLATASDAQIRDAIARGRSGTPMAAFAGDLSADQIDALTAYLRSRAAGWAPPAAVRVRPPPPERAVLNPSAPAAQLDVRDGMFVPADQVQAALQRGERIVLLDARPMSDWQRGHLPGAVPVPFYDDVGALEPHLPKDDTFIVAYCACPHAASGKVARQLRQRGFDRAVVLDEGSLVWAQRGYPLVPGDSGR